MAEVNRRQERSGTPQTRNVDSAGSALLAGRVAVLCNRLLRLRCDVGLERPYEWDSTHSKALLVRVGLQCSGMRGRVGLVQ